MSIGESFRQFIQPLVSFLNSGFVREDKVKRLLHAASRHFTGKDWNKISPNEKDMVDILVYLGYLERNGEAILLPGDTGGT